MLTISVYNRDCVGEDGMSRLDKGTVSLVLCDPPFGVTKNKWDVVIPFDAMWKGYHHVCKRNAAMCLFGNQPFTSELVVSNKKEFRYGLVWEKNKFSDFLNAKRKPMKIHEDILVFFGKQPTYNPQHTQGDPYTRWNKQSAVDSQTNYGKHKENYVKNTDGKRLPTTVLKFNRVERPSHPTQKPEDLCNWLVKTYSNEGDLVLDNCLGSGTTAVSCILTGRSFVGYEKNEEYYHACVRRITESLAGHDVVLREEGDDFVKWSIGVRAPAPPSPGPSSAPCLDSWA
jgi:site-specific DNA-methyltransferase (adenine-specific)